MTFTQNCPRKSTDNIYIRALKCKLHLMNTLQTTLFLLLITTTCSFSQVSVFKDERIDQKVAQRSNSTVSGFRIMISFDSNKDLVDQARNKFVSLYPKVDTYVSFEAPNFVLKVGDFRTQFDAERFKEKIASEFSISIIQKDNINLPRLD